MDRDRGCGRGRDRRHRVGHHRDREEEAGGEKEACEETTQGRAEGCAEERLEGPRQAGSCSEQAQDCRLTVPSFCSVVCWRFFLCLLLKHPLFVVETPSVGYKHFLCC